MSDHRKKKERKLCGDLKVCGTTRTKILKTQNIYPCNPEIPITINGSLNVTENSKICDLSTQNVFPCEGDDIFFNAEVNAKPVLSSINEGIEPYSVFKAEDPNIPHITLVIAPKGNGALVADKPDGTPVGGNNRGINAVDLQMARSKEANVASGRYSTISGGESNTASGRDSVVAGGFANSALGGFESVVSGGSNNLVLASVSIICGGQVNIIERSGSFIGGGNFHKCFGAFSYIGGGTRNSIEGLGSIIGGGFDNRIEAIIIDNKVDSAASFIGGGAGNIIEAKSNYSFIGGGVLNNIKGNYSVIPGGRSNLSTGNYCFAAGRSAQALHDNTYVWSSATDESNITKTSLPNQAVFNVSGTPFIAPEEQNSFIINGNFSVVNGFKNLLIDHPFLENKYIKHISVDSPKPDINYRGIVKLINGKAEVDIDIAYNMTPGTFSKLTKNHQVFLTNRSNPNWDLTQIEDHDLLSIGKFTIISNNNKSNIVVDWLVIAEKILTENIVTEINKPKIEEIIKTNKKDKIIFEIVDSITSEKKIIHEFTIE